MANPYEAPRAVVADTAPARLARPRSVLIGLIILWIVLLAWTLGAAGHLGKIRFANDPWLIGYATYLVGMIVVPAWLLVMNARGRNWARVAAMILTGLDVIYRIALTVVDPALPPTAVGYVLVPAAVQLVGYGLLCTPRSNAWFRAHAQPQ